MSRPRHAPRSAPGGVADVGRALPGLGRAPPGAVELAAGPAELEAPLGAPRRALILGTGEPTPNFDAELLLRVTGPAHPARAGGTRPRGSRRPADAETERAEGSGGRSPHHPASRGRTPERLDETIKVLAVHNRWSSMVIDDEAPLEDRSGAARTAYTRRGGVHRGPVIGGGREHRCG
jgi:hypothetical protein